MQCGYILTHVKTGKPCASGSLLTKPLLNPKAYQIQNKTNKYGNRNKFFKDHVALKKTNPEVYDGLDINFDNLLIAWQAPNPRDYFYKKVFGMSFAEKQASDRREIDAEVAEDRKKASRKKETLEEVQLA